MNPADHLSEKGLAIFLFHGVIEKQEWEVRNYTWKHLERDFFEKVVRDLRNKGQPLSMNEILEFRMSARPYPARSFAITFDDGFENNFTLAAPILEKAGVPGMFYVTTDFVDQQGMSWIDRIEWCLEATPRGSLCFPWDETRHLFETPGERKEILRKIRIKVKSDPLLDVDGVVASIFKQCGKPEIRRAEGPLDRKMTWNQVRELDSHGLFTVGGHSHRHRILSFLKTDELKDEIGTSLKLLREKADVGPDHYSYPEGMAHCFSEEVIQVLKAGGVRCCPTAMEGLNDGKEDLFHLKRINVTME